MKTEDIADELDRLRMTIIRNGYDHDLEYDDLDNMFILANKLRK